MLIKKIKKYKFIFALLLLVAAASCKQEVFTENITSEATELSRVFVDSNPKGAKIYLDGRYTGFVTPDTLKFLSEEQHRVTLKFTLIRDTTLLVVPQNFSTKNLFVDYFASPRNYGSIMCTSFPSGADIYLNGTSTGKKAPNTLPYLFPGIYNVKFKYTGYRDDSTNVTVYGGMVSQTVRFMQDTTTWIDYRLENSKLQSNKVVAMDVDKNNNIWVGTLDYGVAKFTKGKFTHYHTGNSGIVYDFITCVAVDPQNNIWIGTVQGLSRFDGVNWTSFKKDNSALQANYITALHCAADGTVYVGTERGLAKIQGNTVIPYSSVESPLLKEFIAGITVDKNNNLWVSSIGGISVKKPDGWRTFTRSSDGLVAFDGGPIAADAQGNIWVGFPENTRSGIFGGLMKYDGSSWREVSVPAIPKGRIQGILIDSRGYKWLSSANGFLVIKPDGTQNVYRNIEYAMWTYDARQMIIDKLDNAWVALFGGGIVKWKKPYN